MSFCPFHDNARAHTAAVTTGTLEEIWWDILPQPAYGPDLTWPHAKRFSTVRSTQRDLRRKKTADHQPQTLFERGIMKLPKRWRRCTEVQGECTEKYDEVLSGYQPGKMVERWANQHFEDHLCPRPQDTIVRLVPWGRGQSWSSKRWFSHHSTIWPGW